MPFGYVFVERLLSAAAHSVLRRHRPAVQRRDGDVRVLQREPMQPPAVRRRVVPESGGHVPRRVTALRRGRVDEGRDSADRRWFEVLLMRPFLPTSVVLLAALTLVTFGSACGSSAGGHDGGGGTGGKAGEGGGGSGGAGGTGTAGSGGAGNGGRGGSAGGHGGSSGLGGAGGNGGSGGAAGSPGATGGWGGGGGGATGGRGGGGGAPASGGVGGGKATGGAGGPPDGGVISCRLDAGQCPVGFRCGCGGAGPVAVCTCHKECTADTECTVPGEMCGCNAGDPAPRICVNACFCTCR
jgi:hypothetical protein